MDVRTAETFESYVNDMREQFMNAKDQEEKTLWHKRYMDGMERLQAMEHDDCEFLDKKERREIDKERNQQAAELEERKQNWCKVDTAVKLVGLLFAPILSTVVYMKIEDKVGELEENGRWTTDAARRHHQNGPKLPWFGK